MTVVDSAILRAGPIHRGAFLIDNINSTFSRTRSTINVYSSVLNLELAPLRLCTTSGLPVHVALPGGVLLNVLSTYIFRMGLRR